MRKGNEPQPIISDYHPVPDAAIRPGIPFRTAVTPLPVVPERSRSSRHPERNNVEPRISSTVNEISSPPQYGKPYIILPKISTLAKLLAGSQWKHQRLPDSY
ncbi:hypothetical protein KRR40_11425 [Niabella defluvii]|nr:hypothetical protein KRR40_11425 [Niabella sp. I65]